MGDNIGYCYISNLSYSFIINQKILMIIGSINENKDTEKRISVTPENVKKFIANGFNVRGISADTVTDLSFYLNFTQFLFGALWIANVVRADEGQLPSWGKTVGSIQAYGSAAVLFAFYFGVIGQPVFVPALALFGIVLYPAFIYGMSQAFSNN